MRVAVVLGTLAVLGGCSLFRVRARPGTDALRARRLMVPVAGVAPASIVDTFHARRDGGRRRHHALDIMAPTGTPVLAADDGVVLALKRSPHGGITLYAADPHRRFVYYYAHLSRYQPGVTAGVGIERGDVIGYVGSSGNASARAPHLHFQVRAYPADQRWSTGTPVNPFGCFAKPGRRVAGFTR